MPRCARTTAFVFCTIATLPPPACVPGTRDSDRRFSAEPVPSSGIDRRLTRTREAFALHQTIIECRCPSHIGEGVAAGELVGVLAVTGEFLPPDRQANDDSRARAIGDSGAQLDAAPIIEDPHVVAPGHAP